MVASGSTVRKRRRRRRRRRTLQAAKKQQQEEEEEEEEEEDAMSLRATQQANSRGRHKNCPSWPPIYLIGVLAGMATCLLLLATCHALASDARHTRRVLIVQDETLAAAAAATGDDHNFGSLNRSAPAYKSSADEDEDDLLQEEEFKRRLIDSTSTPSRPSAPGGGATNNQTTDEAEEQRGRSMPTTEITDYYGESPPHQVQVQVQVQQSTTEPPGGLVAGFFSHIDKQWKFAEIVLIIAISAILNLVTIVGNIMVLISFKMDRSLQTVSNYFLLSLALADLLIGLISMPLYTLYLLLNYWPLGPLMCDIWLAIDYLNSNAAVLNMLIISFDRYFSVTRPLTYRAKRTTKHACLMISFAWLLSLTIWTPAIFTYPYYKGRTVQGTDKCEIEFVKANTYLTFVTAILAFYIPVAIMIYLYWRIWLETKKRYRDLTTLFLVSGVGAAAPSRPRPPAATISLAGGSQARGGGGGKGSLWARNLASRLHAPRGASSTPRESPPPPPPAAKLVAGLPQPPVLALAGKSSAQGPLTANTNQGPPEIPPGCDPSTHHDDSRGEACDLGKRPSKVVAVVASQSSGDRESKTSRHDQQVAGVAGREPKLQGGQSCKCRARDSSGQRPHIASECKACARAAQAVGRHKCATRKGACCCCCPPSGASVQNTHRTTRHDCAKQRDKPHKGGCRHCATPSDSLQRGGAGQHPAVVSRAHSPRGKPAGSTGGSDLLNLADETAAVTGGGGGGGGKATTSGSRSSLCQRSKVHPKEEEGEKEEEEKAASSEPEEAGAAKLLVDVATSPINFSSSSLVVPAEQQRENVIQQQQQRAPLTPVSPEVEDFETRIVSYGHRFHFETDDPKLAAPGDGSGHHHHHHHHNRHHRHNNHHHQHHLTQNTSCSARAKSGGQSAHSHAAAGKHATCCCAEAISAHDAECRLCRPTHRPAHAHTHAHHHQHSSPASHAHRQHRHHHSHPHAHHHHHHHNHHHHHHPQHKLHHHKHASPGKQCNKCPLESVQPAPKAPINQPSEEQPALGQSLPLLSALQSSHAAATATNNAVKRLGQKLTFSDILVERPSSCALVDQHDESQPQVALVAHDPQRTSPAVSESERELLARRNADRLRCAYEDEDGESTADDARRPGWSWLARLLDLVGLAAPRNSKRPVRYKTNYRAPLEECPGRATPTPKSLLNVLECCRSSSSTSSSSSSFSSSPPRPNRMVSPSSGDEREQRREPQTTDSSDSSDQQQPPHNHHHHLGVCPGGKLRSQQHSSSTKSSSSGSQQQPAAGSGSYNSHSNHHHNHNHNHHHHHHHHHHPIQPKSERKAAKTLSTLLLVFIVTWLPYNVLVLIKTLSGGEDMVPEKIWNFSYYLCYINSTINPLCYALCNAQFRRTYMRILKCKLSNEHNSTRRLVAIQSVGGGGGGGGGSSTAACSSWNKDNASRLNSSSLDGAHHLNHSPQTAAGRPRQTSASNGAHRHSGGRRS